MRVAPVVRSGWGMAVALVAIGWVAGCTESSVSQISGPSAAKCRPALSGLPSSVASGGVELRATVVTTRDCQWTLEPEAPWIQVAPEAGQGETAVVMHVDQNPQSTPRSAAVLLNSERVMLAQDAAPCRFELNRTSAQVAAAGGQVAAAVSTASGCKWTASSPVSWARPAQTGGTGSAQVEVEVEANSGAERSTTLTLAGVSFVVTQDAVSQAAPPPNPSPAPPSPAPSPAPPAPCTFQIDPVRHSVAVEGGTRTLRMRTAAHCTWTVTTAQNWIHPSTTQGQGEADISYRVDANIGAARQGTVTAAGLAHAVDQAALLAPCTFQIDPVQHSVGSDGGTRTLRIRTASHCTWSVTTSQDWIQLLTTQGQGEADISYRVGANTGAARQGTLTAAGLAHTVDQAALPAPCTFRIDPKTFSVGAEGGTGTLRIRTASHCTWSVTTTQDWIHPSTAEGQGEAEITYSVDANSGAARQGTLTAAGLAHAIEQAAAP